MPVDVLAMANSPVALGEALRTIRERVGFSIEGVCAQTSLRTSQLYEIEAGLYEPSTGILEALGDLYGIDTEQLPTSGQAVRKPLIYDADRRVLHVGWLAIEFDNRRHDNDDLLRSFAACVRKLRGVAESAPVLLRESDRVMLADLLNLDDQHLDQRFCHWFRAEPDKFVGVRDALLELAA